MNVFNVAYHQRIRIVSLFNSELNDHTEWNGKRAGRLAVALLLCYMHHGMNFYSCKKQMFKSFSFTKICNGSKSSKTSHEEVMQPTTSNKIYHQFFLTMSTIRQVFDNPFFNGRGLIYLGISKMSFIFYMVTRVQGNV